MTALPSSVLFCCTSNALRSVMAEGLMKFLFGTRVHVDSVGVRAGELDQFAVAVMDEIGIDISRHQPKSFEDLEPHAFDLIISLSPEAQHRAVELTRFDAVELDFWNTFDPSLIEGNREVRLEAYRQVRDRIGDRIKARFTPPAGPSL